MIYPETLPCPKFESDTTSSNNTFILTGFEYGTRLRQGIDGKKSFNLVSIMNETEVNTFRSFFESIYKSDYTFTADFTIAGNDNVNKTFRALPNFNIAYLGALLYNVTLQVEIMDYGTLKTLDCPLYPYVTLYPSDTLYPC